MVVEERAESEERAAGAAGATDPAAGQPSPSPQLPPDTAAQAAPPDERPAGRADATVPRLAREQVQQGFRERARGGGSNQEQAGDNKAAKDAARFAALFVEVAPDSVGKVERVFELPPGFPPDLVAEVQRRAQRVVVIYGQEGTGRSTCALHLGLQFFGFGRGPTSRVRMPGDASLGERDSKLLGLEELLRRLGPDHQCFQEADILRFRLATRVEDERRHGSTAQTAYDISAIVYGAEELCRELLGPEWSLTKLADDALRSVAPAEGDPGTRPDLAIHRSEGRLADFARYLAGQSKDEPTRRVYISERILGPDAGAQDFAQEAVAEITGKLREKDSYLIVIATRLRFDAMKAQLDHLIAVPMDMVRDDEHTPFLKRVYRNHLSFYHPDEGVYNQAMHLHDDWEELELPTPPAIDDYCRRVAQLPPGSDRAALIDLARDVAELTPQAAGRLFATQLSENERLYALLAALFTDLDYFRLDELYTLAVRYLRRDGVTTLRDPRELGLDDVRDRCRIRIDETNDRASFRQGALADVVRQQVVNYHHLLWSFTDVLRELIKELKAPEYWAMRRSLGGVIGRLGVHREVKLSGILDWLARDPAGGVAITAGYALDAICRVGAEWDKLVFDILTDWADSGDFDLMWAAAQATWRVYEGQCLRDRGKGMPADSGRDHLPLRLFEILDKLADGCDTLIDRASRQPFDTESEDGQDDEVALREREQLFDWAVLLGLAICHAQEMIWSWSPQETVEHVLGWLRGDPDTLRPFLGDMALRDLFESSDLPGNLPTWEQRSPLMKFMRPALESTEETLGVVLDAIGIWLERREQWADKLRQSLMQELNQLDTPELLRLRSGIASRWLTSKSPEVREFGQELLTWSYLVGGVPIDLAGQGLGLIVLDGSLPARRREVAQLARRLQERFAGQLDIAVARLGQRAPLVDRDGSLDPSAVEATPPTPRLIVPLLDGYDPARVLFCVVLTTGALVDLDDLGGTPWAARLLLAAVGADIAETDGHRVVPLPARPDDNDLAAVEAAAREHMARALAARPPDVWFQSLARAQPDLPADQQAVAARLPGWLQGLASEAQPAGLARQIIAGIVWLVAADPAGGVPVLTGWLEAEDDGQRRLAAAAATLVFTLYGLRDPAPEPREIAQIIKLAPKLAACHWSGAEAVLTAARAWVAVPTLFECLTRRAGGGRGVLGEAIRAIASSHRGKVRRMVQAWREDERAPLAVREFASWVERHNETDLGKSLPPLDAGQAYLWFVLDGAGAEQERRRFAELASMLERACMEVHAGRVRPVAFALGSPAPLALPGERWAVDTLVPPASPAGVPVLGPLLDRGAASQAAGVFLFTDRAILDAEDWCGTSWESLTWFYGRGATPGWAPRELVRYEGEHDQEIEKRVLAAVGAQIGG